MDQQSCSSNLVLPNFFVIGQILILFRRRALPKCPLQLRLTGLKQEAWNFTQISHTGGKNLMTWTITFCLPGSPLASSWSWPPNRYFIIWDKDIPTTRPSSWLWAKCWNTAPVNWAFSLQVWVCRAASRKSVCRTLGPAVSYCWACPVWRVASAQRPWSSFFPWLLVLEFGSVCIQWWGKKSGKCPLLWG